MQTGINVRHAGKIDHEAVAPDIEEVDSNHGIVHTTICLNPLLLNSCY